MSLGIIQILPFSSEERDIGPRILQAVAPSFSVITVSWEENDGINENLARFYGYQVQYKQSNDSQFIVAVNVSHADDISMYKTNVTGLIHNTEYTVRVVMYRQHGELFDRISHSSDVNTSTLWTGECFFTLWRSKEAQLHIPYVLEADTMTLQFKMCSVIINPL